MSHEADPRLAEDVTGHGVTQDPFEIDAVQPRAARDAFERGFLPEGEALRDAEPRDGVQTDDVFQLRRIFFSPR